MQRLEVVPWSMARMYWASAAASAAVLGLMRGDLGFVDLVRVQKATW
jgi:hypothetical protein